MTLSKGARELRAWIRRSGLKQVEAARRFGVTQSELSRWLSGERVPTLAKAVIVEAETGILERAWTDISRADSGEAADRSAGSHGFDKR